MEQQTVRKTYKYKLKPTPEQERELGRVLGLCRWLYNTALRAAHHRLATCARLRLALSAGSGAEGHPRRVSRIRRHPLAMSCKTCWRGWTRPIRRSFAGCRRARRRASRAIRARPLPLASPTRSLATGRTLDNGFLVLSKIGRIAVRWSPPARGHAQDGHDRQRSGRLVCLLLLCRCASTALPANWAGDGHRPWALKPSLRSRMARASSHPGWYRKAERALKTAQRRVLARKKGSNRRRKAVTLLAKAHQKVRRQRQDFHHKTALALVQSQRHDLSRRLADGQHGQEPPPRQEHPRCGVGGSS